MRRHHPTSCSRPSAGVSSKALEKNSHGRMALYICKISERPCEECSSFHKGRKTITVQRRLGPGRLIVAARGLSHWTVCSLAGLAAWRRRFEKQHSTTTCFMLCWSWCLGEPPVVCRKPNLRPAAFSTLIATHVRPVSHCLATTTQQQSGSNSFEYLSSQAGCQCSW